MASRLGSTAGAGSAVGGVPTDATVDAALAGFIRPSGMLARPHHHYASSLVYAGGPLARSREKMAHALHDLAVQIESEADSAGDSAAGHGAAAGGDTQASSRSIGAGSESGGDTQASELPLRWTLSQIGSLLTAFESAVRAAARSALSREAFSAYSAVGAKHIAETAAPLPGGPRFRLRIGAAAAPLLGSNSATSLVMAPGFATGPFSALGAAGSGSYSAVDLSRPGTGLEGGLTTAGAAWEGRRLHTSGASTRWNSVAALPAAPERPITAGPFMIHLGSLTVALRPGLGMRSAAVPLPLATAAGTGPGSLHATLSLQRPWAAVGTADTPPSRLGYTVTTAISGPASIEPAVCSAGLGGGSVASRRNSAVDAFLLQSAALQELQTLTSSLAAPPDSSEASAAAVAALRGRTLPALLSAVQYAGFAPALPFLPLYNPVPRAGSSNMALRMGSGAFMPLSLVPGSSHHQVPSVVGGSSLHRPCGVHGTCPGGNDADTSANPVAIAAARLARDVLADTVQPGSNAIAGTVSGGRLDHFVADQLGRRFGRAQAAAHGDCSRCMDAREAAAAAAANAQSATATLLRCLTRFRSDSRVRAFIRLAGQRMASSDVLFYITARALCRAGVPDAAWALAGLSRGGAAALPAGHYASQASAAQQGADAIGVVSALVAASGTAGSAGSTLSDVRPDGHSAATVLVARSRRYVSPPPLQGTAVLRLPGDAELPMAAAEGSGYWTGESLTNSALLSGPSRRMIESLPPASLHLPRPIRPEAAVNASAGVSASSVPKGAWSPMAHHGGGSPVSAGSRSRSNSPVSASGARAVSRDGSRSPSVSGRVPAGGSPSAVGVIKQRFFGGEHRQHRAADNGLDHHDAASAHTDNSPKGCPPEHVVTTDDEGITGFRGGSVVSPADEAAHRHHDTRRAAASTRQRSHSPGAAESPRLASTLSAAESTGGEDQRTRGRSRRRSFERSSSRSPSPKALAGAHAAHGSPWQLAAGRLASLRLGSSDGRHAGAPGLGLRLTGSAVALLPRSSHHDQHYHYDSDYDPHGGHHAVGHQSGRRHGGDLPAGWATGGTRGRRGSASPPPPQSPQLSLADAHPIATPVRSASPPGSPHTARAPAPALFAGFSPSVWQSIAALGAGSSRDRYDVGERASARGSAGGRAGSSAGSTYVAAAAPPSRAGALAPTSVPSPAPSHALSQVPFAGYTRWNSVRLTKLLLMAPPPAACRGLYLRSMEGEVSFPDPSVGDPANINVNAIIAAFASGSTAVGPSYQFAGGESARSSASSSAAASGGGCSGTTVCWLSLARARAIVALLIPREEERRQLLRQLEGMAVGGSVGGAEAGGDNAGGAAGAEGGGGGSGYASAASSACAGSASGGAGSAASAAGGLGGQGRAPGRLGGSGRQQLPPHLQSLYARTARVDREAFLAALLASRERARLRVLASLERDAEALIPPSTHGRGSVGLGSHAGLGLGAASHGSDGASEPIVTYALRAVFPSIFTDAQLAAIFHRGCELEQRVQDARAAAAEAAAEATHRDGTGADSEFDSDPAQRHATAGHLETWSRAMFVDYCSAIAENLMC